MQSTHGLGSIRGTISPLVWGIGLGLSVATPVSAAPITDPKTFCTALTVAVAEGDIAQASTVAQANEPDHARDASLRAAIQHIIEDVRKLAPRPGVRYADVIDEKTFGHSIYVANFFYVIGDTEVLIRCRINNIGAGWAFRFLSVSKDFDKLLAE